MGKATKILKDRRCQHCHQVFIMTAKQIAQHAALCQRATGAGLVLPGQVLRPGAGLIVP